MEAAIAVSKVLITIHRGKEVRQRTGLSRSSIYARIKQGTFPPPITLGPRSVGWTSTSIDDWIAAKVAANHWPLPAPPRKPTEKSQAQSEATPPQTRSSNQKRVAGETRVVADLSSRGRGASQRPESGTGPELRYDRNFDFEVGESRTPKP